MGRIYVVEACDGSMLLKRAKDPFGNKSLFLSGSVEEEGVRISYSNKFLDNNDDDLSMRDLCCWSM